MRVKILFWNLWKGKGPKLASSLTNFADEIDLFMFAESIPDQATLLGALNAKHPNRFHRVASQSSRVEFYARQDGVFQDAEWEDCFYDGIYDRITALELLISPNSILLIGTHLVSPSTGISPTGRAEWARRVAADIRSIEKKIGHHRTILVGDLNMNPFDEGLVSATALHAMMSRQLVLDVRSHKHREQFLPFYNPMWSFLGDFHDRSPGTHFFENTHDLANYFWQTYDQLLVRPELMDQITRLEIKTYDGVESLLTNTGRPSGTKSDHLPIFFELDL